VKKAYTIVSGHLRNRFTLNVVVDPTHNFTEAECVHLATKMLVLADVMRVERETRARKAARHRARQKVVSETRAQGT